MASNDQISFHEFQEYRRFLANNPNFRAAPGPQPSTPTPASRVSAAEQDSAQQSNQAPAVTQPYQSARVQVQPAPLVTPSTYLPVLGMHTLAPSASTLNASHTNQARVSAATLNTSNANRDRINHANVVLPRRATTSLVARRPRGPAQPSPVLPYRRVEQRPSINQCLVPGAEIPTANVLALVYPPLDPNGGQRHFLVYRTLHTDFVETMESYHLAYRYTLRLDSPVNDFLRRLVMDLAASPAGFIFPIARRASTSASTTITTVQLLGLRDSGRPYRDVGVRLQILPHDLGMTIHDLAVDGTHFSGKSCFRDSNFIIRVAVMGETLTDIREGRRHTCLSTHIYALFPQDSNTMGVDEEDTSGGESVDEDGDVEPARLLWPILTPSAPRNTARPNTRIPAGTAESGSAARQPRLALRDIPVTRSRTRSLTPLPPVFRLPSEIWSENTNYTSRSSGEYGPNRFTDDVCRAAVRGSGSIAPLQVHGRDMDAAADCVEQILDEAGSRRDGLGDYTEFMTTDRSFALTTDVAFGEGVEREVLYTCIQRYIKDETTWFQRGKETSLSCVPCIQIPSSPSQLPVLWASSVSSPAPISVAIFQYLINNCNLHSVSQTFIGEWFPELRHFLLTLLATPETDDLRPFQSHFINVLGIEASAFRNRDRDTHLGLAVNILFKATIANATFDKPELQAFRTGYLLSCRNGFTFPNAVRNFQGGSETFLSVVATSYISSADSVLAVIDTVNPTNHAMLVDALRSHTGDITLTFEMLIERYLRGVGIPCPEKFEASSGAFHPIIDMTHIHTPSFRAQVLVWAATGSPFIDAAGSRISLGPINTHGDGYGPPGSDAALRNLLASNGTFHLQTCHRSARYPVEHVLRLAQAQYVPEGEPGDFQEAFDFWFLHQCLIHIGRHNIL
ncbi:hypothetical protein B0H19DRAFT_1073286 [Mycena capillaripes]|nr:hypothetical protein B0H19DRAFT_1073286 [Mycena capillaripes]